MIRCSTTKKISWANLVQVAMDSTPPPRMHNAAAYSGLYGQLVTQAAFTWWRRSLATEQPHITLADILALEQRIAASLNGLMTSAELGWESCEAAMALGEPGEQFTATVVALRSHDVRHIQAVVESGLKSEQVTTGLISAFGWLGSDIISPWIVKFLNGKDLNHKYLGIAACSVRRADPGEKLNEILKREDCRQHIPLYTRALRLVGELRRLDLMTALHAAAVSPEPSIAFWANWSLILLGQHAAIKPLQPLVCNRGPHQARALQMAFRVLPIGSAQEWISAMSQDPVNVRTVITATGVLGDPHAVNWLIGKMTDPLLARLAGEAFTNITGVDLVKYRLHQEPRVDQPPVSPDESIGAPLHQEDENLPLPDVDKVAALWRHHGSNFMVGRRYFLGKPITPEWLKSWITEGTMRQRHAAALELALIDPNSRLANTRAKVFNE